MPGRVWLCAAKVGKSLYPNFGGLVSHRAPGSRCSFFPALALEMLFTPHSANSFAVLFRSNYWRQWDLTKPVLAVFYGMKIRCENWNKLIKRFCLGPDITALLPGKIYNCRWWIRGENTPGHKIQMMVSMYLRRYSPTQVSHALLAFSLQRP